MVLCLITSVLLLGLLAPLRRRCCGVSWSKYVTLLFRRLSVKEIGTVLYGIKCCTWFPFRCRRNVAAFELRSFALRFIHSHSDATGVFSQCIPGKLSRWRLPATVLDTLYPLKMTPLPGYWDGDHDRPRLRNISIMY